MSSQDNMQVVMEQFLNNYTNSLIGRRSSLGPLASWRQTRSQVTTSARDSPTF
jgi:hypothetical protein